MKPIVEVQRVSKKYNIQHLSGGYLSLRDRISNALSFERKTIEEFWALNDVSFNVQAGECLGIIGKNGAGKSTLLKILSKITLPSRGRIITRGRIASLLEVGTGFHPELTGRENIFFNGSLLGMKRKEILYNFDAIVDFSGIEKFLDTPLKHYSSGMQLRLAFAVAAFLEPEILVIDEVLAVGDAEFQKKCIGKMEDVTRSGRTILFVSHNMQAVANLCSRGMVLEKGAVKMFGSASEALELYLKADHTTNKLHEHLAAAPHDKDFKLINITLSQDGEQVFQDVVNGKNLRIEIEYEILNQLTDFRVFLDVIDTFGTNILRSFHNEGRRENKMLTPGRYTSTVLIPANLLASISYWLKFQFGVHQVRMLEPKDGVSLLIRVEQTGEYNKAYHGQYTSGVISPVLNWETVIKKTVNERIL